MPNKMETLISYLNQLVIYCGVLILSAVINAANQFNDKLRDIWTSTVTTIKNTGHYDVVLNSRVIECCETVGAEEVDCTSMTMIGGSMGKLPVGGLKNVTFLYPNMYLYNRKGECSVEIWFRDPQNRTGSIKANIKFDTYVRRGNVPVHMEEYEHVEDLYSLCSSPDLDPLDGCRPVDCHKKYNGHKNYFQQGKKLCVCNPTCYSNPDKDLPDIVYLPTCNQCRDLEEPISDQDINVLLRQANSDLPKEHRCGTQPLGTKEYGNVRCHHGVFDKESGTCACEPGWTSARTPDDLYIPSTLLLHFCTVRSPTSPVLDMGGIGRAVLFSVASQDPVSFLVLKENQCLTLGIVWGRIIFVAGVVSGLLLLAILLLTVKTGKKYRNIHEIRKSRSNSSKHTSSRSNSPSSHSGKHDSVNLEREHSDHQRKDGHEYHERKSSHDNDKHDYSTNRDSNKSQAKNTRDSIKNNSATNVHKNTKIGRSSRSLSYRSVYYRPESIKSRQSGDRKDTTIMTVLTGVSNSDEPSEDCCVHPFRAQKQTIGSIREINIKNHDFDTVSSINKPQTRNPYKINQIPLERKACVKKKIKLTNQKKYWRNCIRVILSRSLDHAVLWKKMSDMLETVVEEIKELKSVQNKNIICKNTTVVPNIQLLDTHFKENNEYFNQNQQRTLNDTISCRNDDNVCFEVGEDLKNSYSDDIYMEETSDHSIETQLSKSKHTPSAKELILVNDLTKILSYQIPILINNNNHHEINEKRDQSCYQLGNKLTEKSMLPRNTILNKEPVIMEGNKINLCNRTAETTLPKIDNFVQNSSVKSLFLKDESNLETRDTSKSAKSFIPVKKSVQKSCDESKPGNEEQSVVKKIEKYSLLPKEENSASIYMPFVNSPVEDVHLKLNQTIKMDTPFGTKQEINNTQKIHKTAQKVKHNTRINKARKLVASNIGKFMKYVTTKDNKIIVDDIIKAFCKRPEYDKWIKLFEVNDTETDRKKLRQQYKIIKSFERAIVAVNNFASGQKMKRNANNSRQRKAEDCLIVFCRSQGELKRYSTLVGNYLSLLDTADEGLGPLLQEHGPPFDPNAFPVRGLLRLNGDVQARRLISGLLHHPSGHFAHVLFLFGEPDLLDGLLGYCGSVARIKYNRELRVHTPPPASRLYDFVLKNLLNPPINVKKSSITTDIPHLNILWRSTLFFQENEINEHTFTIAMNFLSTISTNKMIKITKEKSTDLKSIQNIYNDFLSVQIQKDKLQVPFKIIEILLKNLQTMKRRETIVKLVNTQIKNFNCSLSLNKKQPKINNVVNQMKRDLDNAVTRYYETFGEFDYC